MSLMEIYDCCVMVEVPRDRTLTSLWDGCMGDPCGVLGGNGQHSSGSHVDKNFHSLYDES